MTNPLDTRGDLEILPLNAPPPCRSESDLAGRVLIQSHEGIGDDLLGFPAIIEAMRRHEIEPIIECDPRLVTLYQRSLPVAVHPFNRRITGSQSIQDYEWARPYQPSRRIKLRQLWEWMHGDGFGPSLTPDPERVARIKPWVESLPGPHVGIVWWNVGNKESPSRRISYPSDTSELTTIWESGADLISLQHGYEYRQPAGVLREHPEIDRTNDIEGMAALISCLDVVIAPPTATLWLAAALGRECWTVSFEGHRPLRGDRFPGYPNVLPIVIEQQEGAWAEVAQVMGRILGQRVNERSRGLGRTG